MAADPTGRAPAKFPCIYWNGLVCTANQKFPVSDISCFNDGTCDGFGTCRGCTKYDQGGLKFDDVDGQSGFSQTPMNLQMYNLRARLQPCCNWDGPIADLSKAFVRTDTQVGIASVIVEAGNTTINTTGSDLEGFLSAGQLVGIRPGEDINGDPFPKVNIKYASRTNSSFLGVTMSPAGVLDTAYTLFLAERKAVPVFRVISATPDVNKGEVKTLCTVTEAAPWQEAFTEENPSAFGCNGAKAECPFYTGPKFTELVAAKMDKGDRITPIQVMELRYYSQDWTSVADDAFQDPRELWESLFDQPDIWAQVRDLNALQPGTAVPYPPDRAPPRRDVLTGKPLIRKITIDDFAGDTPNFSVGSPVLPEDGTPVLGGPPKYPTLIRDLFSLVPAIRVIFPKGTTSSNPFVKKTFTPGDRFFYISFLAHTDREIVAINLTKYPQDNLADEDFIAQTKLVDPEAVTTPFISGLPGKTIKVEMEYGGSVQRLNHIRIFVDTGLGEEDEVDSQGAPGSFDPNNERPSLPNGKRKFIKVDVFINHVFYHAHVAQTYFDDLYGHKAIDPWINHFTKMRLGGEVINLTGNTRLAGVFWNTIAGDGKKTLYSIETSEEASSSDEDKIRWESLHCGYILVEFLDKKINRTVPWQAWGTDSKGQDLFVRLNRSGNSQLTGDEPTEVEYELAFASTKGTVIPANMAVFRPVGGTAIRPPDPTRDEVSVRYAYTEHKQGPMPDEDLIRLKFPSDAGKIITALPYDVVFDTESFDIDGCFVRAGGEKFYSCDEILGDCYTKISQENELLARQSFLGGGMSDDNVLTNVQMVNQCAQEFNSRLSGLEFEDGVPVTFSEAVKRMQNISFKEGSQHYTFVFEDEEGRPIGVKNYAFLTQSALPQARDVEIRYKWGTQAQHYPNINAQFMFASLYKPLHSTTRQLRYLVQPYDPHCGDHAATEGGTQYRAFDLAVDRHGPLWYPYKRCLKPEYHADSSFFVNTVEYTDRVEGFDDELRRNYWERARGSDKYMPIIIAFNLLIGCVWSEITSTVNNNPPYVFLGYTKIRSSHPFGYYSTDRESLRVSRHWEKRNLAVNEEVIRQDEDDNVIIELSDEYASKLYNEDGTLKTGAELETPIWVHINDGFSVVSPASESRQHPFGNLLLERTGSHLFNEVYDASEDNRVELSSILEDRDYTSSLNRSEDGTKIYLADGTEVNAGDGVSLEVEDGRDVRWAYKKDFGAANLDGSVAWVWLADPPRPVRGSPAIGGLFLSNPRSLFFKQNKVPATHTTEGAHFIDYTPHLFADDGTVEVQATISMDAGPEYYIDLETGFLAIPDGSPYDEVSHEDEEYEFRLFGQGPGGIGILADNRGLQRFGADGERLATLAGININPQININDLPYRVVDIFTLSRLQSQSTKVEELLADFSTETGGLTTGFIDLKGHYFLEKIIIEFSLGGDYDIPSISVEGRVEGLDSTGNTILFSPTNYISGGLFEPNSIELVELPINVRVSTVKLSLGARAAGRKLNIISISILIRENINARENIFIYAPLANVSTGFTGTHHPAELEFYFQRSFPDHSKNYLDGQILVDRIAAAYHEVSYVPGVEIKYTGRRIKDILPHYEFSDPINLRFPYNNIDITAVPDYVEQQTSLGILKYLNSAVRTSSKGWTMWTTEHKDDPAGDLSHFASFDKVRPFEEIQETLYFEAAGLLGDKVSVYRSFWHPKEVEFFAKVGIDLELVTWNLVLTSTVASIDKVFRHEDYGCASAATNEYMDGFIHKIENWQARGVFHYQCDARFNYGCFTTLMNKCNTFLFREYGTPNYLNNDVFGRFNYVFAFPPREYGSYVAAGLIDKNYFSGVWSGFNPTSAAAAAYSAIPSTYEFDLIYKPILGGPRGPGPFQ